MGVAYKLMTELKTEISSALVSQQKDVASSSAEASLEPTEDPHAHLAPQTSPAVNVAAFGATKAASGKGRRLQPKAAGKKIFFVRRKRIFIF